MPTSLQVSSPISATAHYISGNGNNGGTSQLAISSDKTGIKTTNPQADLDVAGSLQSQTLTVSGLTSLNDVVVTGKANFDSISASGEIKATGLTVMGPEVTFQQVLNMKDVPDGHQLQPLFIDPITGFLYTKYV